MRLGFSDTALTVIAILAAVGLAWFVIGSINGLLWLFKHVVFV